MEIKVGQIWQDWDTRFRNHPPTYKQVVKIQDGFAYVIGFKTIEADGSLSNIISKSRIRLDRFKPTSTGYKLVK